MCVCVCVCVCVWKPCKSPTKLRGFAKHSLNTSFVEYDTTENERFLPSLRVNQIASVWRVEDLGSRMCRNVGTYLPNCTELHIPPDICLDNATRTSDITIQIFLRCHFAEI